MTFEDNVARKMNFSLFHDRGNGEHNSVDLEEIPKICVTLDYFFYTVVSFARLYKGR